MDLGFKLNQWNYSPVTHALKNVFRITSRKIRSPFYLQFWIHYSVILSGKDLFPPDLTLVRFTVRLEVKAVGRCKELYSHLGSLDIGVTGCLKILLPGDLSITCFQQGCHIKVISCSQMTSRSRRLTSQVRLRNIQCGCTAQTLRPWFRCSALVINTQMLNSTSPIF